MEFINEIIKLNREIISCKQVNYKDLTALPSGEAEKLFLQPHLTGMDPLIADFYSQLKSYNLEWETKSRLGEKIYGRVRFIEPAKVLSDWKGIVYFEEDSPLKNFKIFDQFANEGCCGFYTTASKTSASSLIYFYDFNSDPVSLQLNIEEYCSMMIEAKGFLYWQRVLIDHRNRIESPHTRLMKEEYDKVFPEFNFQSFIEKYNALIK